MSRSQQGTRLNLSYPYDSFEIKDFMKIVEDLGLDLEVKRARVTGSNIDLTVEIASRGHDMLDSYVIARLKSFCKTTERH